MIHQDGRLAGLSQALRDLLALGRLVSNAAVIRVHRVRVVEVADVLVNHLQWPRKRRVGPAVHRVRVADGMHVGPRAVYGAVDLEPGRVDGPGRIATDDLAVDVDAYHVTGLQQAKMHAERVDPEAVGPLRVTHADVARDTLGVALASKNPEGCRHVFELPLPRLSVRAKIWDAGEAFASVSHGGQGVNIVVH